MEQFELEILGGFLVCGVIVMQLCWLIKVKREHDEFEEFNKRMKEKYPPIWENKEFQEELKKATIEIIKKIEEKKKQEDVVVLKDDKFVTCFSEETLNYIRSIKNIKNSANDYEN